MNSTALKVTAPIANYFSKFATTETFKVGINHYIGRVSMGHLIAIEHYVSDDDGIEIYQGLLGTERFGKFAELFCDEMSL